MRLLDRYVLRNFLEPFFICFFGFVAIWLVFDLQGNMNEFIEGHASFKLILLFYRSQLPFIGVLSIPIALLLALLFCLTRMSRHNEIISMITAGQSIPRIIAPFLGVGLLATGAVYLLNREMGPHAEAMKRRLLDQLSHPKKQDENLDIDALLFRDRMNNRTWYVQRMKQNSPQLDKVHITQQDASGAITSRWYAMRALYDPKDRSWTLLKGMRVDYDKDGDTAKTDMFLNGNRRILDWSETPWRIASSMMEAQNMSVSELREYLKQNADFPPAQLAPFRTNLADRMAHPWSSLVVILLAAPLGIVFSRRGVLAGVAATIFLFFAMTMVRSLCLAIGKGARVDPVMAGWFPTVFFSAVGLILLYCRTTGRDLPKLAFWR